ncbi:hypothetical protein QBC32DRAFT_407409 [Pseudoneurospora amorphoporcata]|uniref:Uncharacterized protein n=1 Tax=Pseudoneurospora amorphoporcata TaxID=241081 RepID=A0AAN6NQD7_9PEZI|nr:hypothetical protein QBC32DRAFT_407409 [Pseudoneurospora amorphoporcata]
MLSSAIVAIQSQPYHSKKLAIMFAAALQKHRALIRASEQQEATSDTPLSSTYHKEASPHYRVPFRHSVVEAKQPVLERYGHNDFKTETTPNNEHTTEKKVTVRKLDEDVSVSESKDSVPIVDTSNVGQNNVVAPMTKAFSNIYITPKSNEPYKGTGDNYVVIETNITATHEQKVALPNLEGPRRATWGPEPVRVAESSAKTPDSRAGTTVSASNRREKSAEQAARKEARRKEAEREKAVREELIRRSWAKRSAKAQKERETWTSHSFVDQNGRINTKLNWLGKMGKQKARQRCTWELKPFSLARYVLEIDEPIPQVMLTDPEGRRYFLEDPTKYKD